MGMSGHASGEAVVGVTIAMVAMAGLVVLCRLFTRICIVKSPGLDDAFITASLLFSVATTVTMCLQVHWGMSRHQLTLTIHQSVESQKPFYVSIPVYNLAMGCTKYSILLQYLRIFPQRTFRRACYAMLAVNTVYLLWTTGSAVFACWPISYFWTQVRVLYGEDGGVGRCLDRFAVWFANAALNIATDIAIGILPLPVLKQLQLPKRQRIALMIVFGLGGFTCLISILRLQSLYVISRASDITWENPLAAIWSCVEVNTGILCSCLPTLKAALSRCFPRLFHSAIRSDSSPPNHHAHGHRRSTLDTLKRHSRKLSFDALGRGLTGRSEPTQCSTISGKTDLGILVGGGVEMKDFGTQTGSCGDCEWEGRGGIQVVTTVEQDVEDVDFVAGGRWYDGGGDYTSYGRTKGREKRREMGGEEEEGRQGEMFA